MFNRGRWLSLSSLFVSALFVGLVSVTTTASAQQLSLLSFDDRLQAVGPDSPGPRTGPRDVSSDLYFSGFFGAFGQLQTDTRSTRTDITELERNGDDVILREETLHWQRSHVDLNPSFGVDAGYEYRIASFLSLGARLRYMNFQLDVDTGFGQEIPRMHSFGAMIAPKVRFVTTATLNEVYLTVPVGPTYTLPPDEDELAGADEADEDGLFDYTVSPALGMVFRTGRDEPGLYFEFSWVHHGIGYDSEEFREDGIDSESTSEVSVDGTLIQPTVDMGVIFSF